LPTDTRGVPRVDDRRVISGIVQVLRSGARWIDAPAVYGPRKTLYNRFVRWAARGVWRAVFTGPGPVRRTACRAALGRHLRQGPSLRWRRERGADAQAIGRSRGGHPTKIHTAVDEQGRPVAFELSPGQRGDARVALSLIGDLPAPPLCLADAAYDSDGLRRFLIERGCLPVIPNHPTRKRRHPFDREIY
jgi:transposase